MTDEQKDYLIWSYEHKAWWSPDHCGYTPNILHAGLYTLAEATEVCECANYAPGVKHEEARLLRDVLATAREWNGSVGDQLAALQGASTRKDELLGLLYGDMEAGAYANAWEKIHAYMSPSPSA
jgi:hypothetical protein